MCNFEMPCYYVAPICPHIPAQFSVEQADQADISGFESGVLLVFRNPSHLGA